MPKQKLNHCSLCHSPIGGESYKAVLYKILEFGSKGATSNDLIDDPEFCNWSQARLNLYLKLMNDAEILLRFPDRNAGVKRYRYFINKAKIFSSLQTSLTRWEHLLKDYYII